MNTFAILIPLLLIAISACDATPVAVTGMPATEPPPVTQQTSGPPVQEPTPLPPPVAQVDPPPIQPLPPADPPAPSLPMPARRVFVADWTGPSIGLTGFMVRKMPPEYSSGDINAKWFTNPAPGLEGFDCADPAPNAAYHVEDGCLVMTPAAPPTSGFPIISAQTFSKDFNIAVDCEIWFDEIGIFGSFGGPVLDNGEDNYFAEYGQNCGDGKISLIVDQNLADGAPPMTEITAGEWHRMTIHYSANDGVFRILLDNKEYIPAGTVKPYKFRNDPHLSIFCGWFKKMKIRKLEVWSDDPNAKAV